MACKMTALLLRICSQKVWPNVTLVMDGCSKRGRPHGALVLLWPASLLKLGRSAFERVAWNRYMHIHIRTPALPNPRYPALPRQDTSYTWTLADRCYQLWLHSRRSFGEFSLPSCRYTLEPYRQSHRRSKKSFFRNFILSSVAFVLLALLQDPSIVLVLSPCGRYCLNPSMAKITLGHTFREQILSKRVVILQVLSDMLYLLTLV